MVRYNSAGHVILSRLGTLVKKASTSNLINKLGSASTMTITNAEEVSTYQIVCKLFCIPAWSPTPKASKL